MAGVEISHSGNGGGERSIIIAAYASQAF